MNLASTEPNPRERLRRLLLSEAIVYSGIDQSIFDRVGNPMPWIFYNWGISLTHEGASLAADCLIDALAHFESVQVAGAGATALPLVSSIVSRGLGRYSGLYVRAEPEKWGTQRQVEGVADKGRPVVVVDDSLCSGNTLRSAFAVLEKEGYRVEGALCLVNFPWKGGAEWARALGYRVETLFDIWTDLEMSENRRIPACSSVDATFDPAHRVPEGLSPADAARWISTHILEYGLIPTPPKRLDRGYEASGGVMVSFRDRVSDYRVARDGFYHLDSTQANLGRDVVLATAKTLLSSKGAVAQYGLNRLKLGVTLFGEQVRSAPSQLDFSRFGILIQSNVQPWKLAGALPNTQFFVSEIEQFRHARFTNAHLFAHEPFTIFRHTVSKSIESGCSWLSFGVPASDQNDGEPDNIGELLVVRAREVLRSAQGRPKVSETKLPPGLFSEQVHGIAISLYYRGMIGCWMSWQSDLDAMICEATTGAWNDKRWKHKADLRSVDVDIVVSVFQLAEVLGSVNGERAAHKLRLGRDSLAVCKGKQSTILLPFTPCHRDWSKKEMAQYTLSEAGISQAPFQWATYSTRNWLGQSDRVSHLEFGYPRRRGSEEALSYRATARLLAYYILDKIGSSGLPDYCYYPIFDHSIVAESATRIILALEALLHAGSLLDDQIFRKAALSGLHYCCEHIKNRQGTMRLDLAETTCGVSSDVFLINAVYRSGEQGMTEMSAVRSLARRLRGLFHADGAITWQRHGRRLGSDHDLFPGFALRMAASVAEVEGREALPCSLHNHLSWYQRRFRLQHPWGMVWWQIQGWAPLYRLTGEQSMASFVYELADWALEHQLDKNGAFLVDYSPDGPSFHTACVLEGIADAWALACRAGDSERARNYGDAWKRGIKFIDRLIIREEDTFAMPKPLKSLGGVRQSLTGSTVRIDYVAHALLALIKGSAHIAERDETEEPQRPRRASRPTRTA